MATPDRGQSNNITTQKLAELAAQQLVRIYSAIEHVSESGKFDVIFYEDVYEENRITLGAQGYTLYLAVGRDDEQCYHIRWR